jgi:hypothetical protein
MATVVETIDFDAVFRDITSRLEKEKERRLLPPSIRLFDGDWNLRGYVKKENNASFQFLDNETGTAQIEMPIDYYLSTWMVNVDARQTTNINVVMEKDGARWSGQLYELKVIKNEEGQRIVRAIFRHDYEHLKHILGYANPFVCRPCFRVGAAGRDLILTPRGAISAFVGSIR